MNEQKCGNCKHFKRYSINEKNALKGHPIPGDGSCVRFPPRLFFVDRHADIENIAKDFISLSPAVKADEICGEWTATTPTPGSAMIMTMPDAVLEAAVEAAVQSD